MTFLSVAFAPFWASVVFLINDTQRTGIRRTVLAYRNTGKDVRRLVEPITQTVAKSAGSAYSLNCTGDGCYWFTQPAADSPADDVFARFDGKSVQVYPDARIVNGARPEIFTILSGSDGILVVTKTTCLLITPRGIHRAATVEGLIAENAADVARTFSGPTPIRIGDLPATVHADGAGNIWLVQRPSGELKVFAQGVWLDAADALRKAGDLRGQALLFMPVGQDRKMLVIDRDPWNIARNQRGKTSFLVSLEDKTIVAEPVPDVANPRLSAEIPYSPSGDPWLDISPDPPKPFPTSLCRMTAKGPADVIDNAIVLAGDGSGGLWIAFRPSSAEREELRLYRDGASIAAPACGGGASGRLWTAPGGRICSMSVLGLEVVTAKQLAGVLTWDAPETLRFAGIESAPEVHAISVRGFVAVSPTRTAGSGSPNLFFYPLDRP